MQQRRAVGAAAERGGVIRVREQHGLAGRVHQRGHRLLVGVDAPRHPRHLVRVPVAGARRELAQQPARPARCR